MISDGYKGQLASNLAWVAAERAEGREPASAREVLTGERLERAKTHALWLEAGHMELARSRMKEDFGL